MTSPRRRFIGAAASLGTLAATRPAAAQYFPLPQPTPFGQQVAPVASVAVLGPMSGKDASLGQQLANGVRGAFDDANGLGGGMDHFWSLRTFDDQDTLANALLVARFAIDDQNQSAAIGHLGSTITSQVIRYYSDANMALIVPATTADGVTSQGYRNVFRLPTKDSTEGILHAKFVKAEKRGTKIGVVYLDGDYGPDVARTFLRQTAGDRLSPFEVKLPADHPDFGAAAGTIVGQNADLVFLAGLAPALGPLIPALRNAGWKGQLDASAGFFDAGLWPSYGKQVDGIVVSSSMPPLQIVPAALAVKTQYEQRYGAMTPIAAFAYASAQIFITAVRRFGSTQRISVLRAIAQPIAIDTLVGSFTFDPFGDPLDPNVYFYLLENGAWHYVRAAHPSSYIVH
jgi:branched-chain amino acid transport system substrate-binding protein